MVDKLRDMFNGRVMHFTILALVLINAVILGMESESEIFKSQMPMIVAIDLTVLTLLTISVLLRAFVFRSTFFNYGWNTFDLIVVIMSILGHMSDLPILKLFRVFLVFRIIVFFPSIKMLVEALIYAFKGIVGSVIILSIVFYAFSIAGYYLFQGAPGENFATLGTSFATLFQLMVFDSFGDITQPIVAVMPLAWIFFIAFLFSTAFSFLNLLIGIFVDAINTVHQREYEKEAAQKLAKKIAKKK